MRCTSCVLAAHPPGFTALAHGCTALLPGGTHKVVLVTEQLMGFLRGSQSQCHAEVEWQCSRIFWSMWTRMTSCGWMPHSNSL